MNLNKKDLQELQAIADSNFGKDYLNIHTILYPHKNNHFLKYEKTTEITGFIYLLILSKRELNPYIMQPILADHEISDEKFGIIKTAAVAPNHQGSGIGNNLFQKAFYFFQKNKINQIYTIIWEQSPNREALENLLLKNNFYFQNEIKDYWMEDSVLKKYDCPLCGNPCRCSAQIYLKNIEPIQQ